MRLTIAAIGKLKSGPERDLCDRYLDRAQKSGRALGLTRIDIREFNEGRAARTEDRRQEEAIALMEAIPEAAEVIVLDEHGPNPTSVEFAKLIAGHRDHGMSDLVFVIGGPDGHGAAMIARANRSIAFGAMTWPHQVVRVLLAEQIYRATTILSGHPYHRS